jgi:hypothetical protein
MTSLRELIIKKYLQNQTCGSIFRDLSKLNVKRNFVYQTFKRYIENGTVRDHRVVIKKIRERIRRKCNISARKLAVDLKFNSETVRFLLKNDLQLSAYKKKFMDMKKLCKRAKILLSRHAGDELFFFGRENVCPGATTERAK